MTSIHQILGRSTKAILLLAATALLPSCYLSIDYMEPRSLSSFLPPEDGAPTPTPSPTPPPVTATGVSKIANGFAHSCALLASGAVKCWGVNSSGQLGYDDTTNRGGTLGSMAALAEVNLGAGRTATDIALGSSFSCALLDTGDVKCWGLNGNGQLGYDDFTARGNTLGSMASLSTVNLGVGRTAKAISAGSGHVCVILDTDAVKCWGNGGDGQLGNDDADSGIGDAAGEMAALGTVNLGVGRTAKVISAGGISTCAILDNNTVKCWGFNEEGILGYDRTDNLGDDPGEMAALGTVNLGVGRTAIAISTSDSHTCAVLDDGTAKCWGASYNGEGGYEDYNSRGWTLGDMAALGPIFLGVGRTAKDIKVASKHTCAILDDDSVKCWGDASRGQLGYDSPADQGGNPGSMTSLATVDLGLGRSAKQISLGYDFTCAVLDNDEAKCWGRNLEGQLGYDSLTNEGNAPGDMAALPYLNLEP